VGRAWGIAGAAFNTSAKGPFSSSCSGANGYFATWAAFFSSLYFVSDVYIRPTGTASYEPLP
jgi:hypothetical protein